MQRIVRIVSPLVALAIVWGSVQSLTSNASTEPAPAREVVSPRTAAVLPDLGSVSRLLGSELEPLDQIAADTVPEAVRNLLIDSGSVLLLPTPKVGGVQ